MKLPRPHNPYFDFNIPRVITPGIYSITVDTVELLDSLDIIRLKMHDCRGVKFAYDIYDNTYVVEEISRSPTI